MYIRMMEYGGSVAAFLYNNSRTMKNTVYVCTARPPSPNHPLISPFPNPPPPPSRFPSLQSLWKRPSLPSPYPLNSPHSATSLPLILRSPFPSFYFPLPLILLTLVLNPSFHTFSIPLISLIISSLPAPASSVPTTSLSTGSTPSFHHPPARTTPCSLTRPEGPI